MCELNYPPLSRDSLSTPVDSDGGDHREGTQERRRGQTDYLVAVACSRRVKWHGTFGFINRLVYRPASLNSGLIKIGICSERLLMILLWQPGGEACQGKWAVQNATGLVNCFLDRACRGWCAKVDVALLDGSGWRWDCAILFANNTCAFIHSSYVTSVIFTLCDVHIAKSNRNSGLKLASSKPFKMLDGAPPANGSLCFGVSNCPTNNKLLLISRYPRACRLSQFSTHTYSILLLLLDDLILF